MIGGFRGGVGTVPRRGPLALTRNCHVRGIFVRLLPTASIIATSHCMKYNNPIELLKVERHVGSANGGLSRSSWLNTNLYARCKSLDESHYYQARSELTHFASKDR